MNVSSASDMVLGTVSVNGLVRKKKPESATGLLELERRGDHAAEGGQGSSTMGNSKPRGDFRSLAKGVDERQWRHRTGEIKEEGWGHLALLQGVN